MLRSRFDWILPLLCLLPGLLYIRYWRPTPGPYVVNKVYPFGDFLQSTLVTVGTNWLAYGLLLLALLVVARTVQTLWAKVALLFSGLLVAIPYLVELVAHVLYGTTAAPHANYPTKFHAALPVVTLILVALVAMGLTTYQVAKSVRGPVVRPGGNGCGSW